MGKICKKCGSEKKQDRNGHWICCLCRLIAKKRRYHENIEKSREIGRKEAKKRYEKNPQIILETNKKWRIANKKKTNLLSRKWNEKNPEKRKAITKKYADAHREEIRLKSEKHRKENQDYYTKKSYEWKKRNPEKRKAQSQVYWAVKTGKIQKPNFCYLCKKECIPMAHHKDYNKPYLVTWLCPVCHGLIHSMEKVEELENLQPKFHEYEVKKDFSEKCKHCGEQMELKEYSSGRRDWKCMPCERKRLRNFKAKKRLEKQRNKDVF